MKHKEIKVAFIGKYATGWFNNWLATKKNIKVVIYDNPAYADYILINHDALFSFKQACKKYEDKILISVTGECLSPDFNMVDYAISFDDLSYGDRYVKAPYVDYKGLSKKVNAKKELSKKTGFCNFIYSQGNAHANRDKFFHMLSEYKKVDSLGEHLRNVIKKKSTRRCNDWFALSIEEKSPYKFSLSFENAIYRGYTTEKIHSSMLANSIPVYWGDPDISKYYNTEAFINCHDYNNFDGVIEKIKELNDNDEKYIDMLSQPWQTREQKKKVQDMYKDLYEFFDNIFFSPYEEAFRKPVGTWATKYKQHLLWANNSVINAKWLRSNFLYFSFKKGKRIIRVLGFDIINNTNKK